MAGLTGVVTADNVSLAGSDKTILRYNAPPTGAPGRITRVVIGFQGIATTGKPPRVHFVHCNAGTSGSPNAAGTPSNSRYAPVHLNQGMAGIAFQSTGDSDFSNETGFTVTGIVDASPLHEQLGREATYDEIAMDVLVLAGEGFAIRAIENTTGVDCSCTIYFEE